MWSLNLHQSSFVQHFYYICLFTHLTSFLPCVLFFIFRESLHSAGSNTSFNVVLMFFYICIEIFFYLRGVTSNALLFAATAIKITRIRYNINYFQPKMLYIVYSRWTAAASSMRLSWILLGERWGRVGTMQKELGRNKRNIKITFNSLGTSPCSVSNWIRKFVVWNTIKHHHPHIMAIPPPNN